MGAPDTLGGEGIEDGKGEVREEEEGSGEGPSRRGSCTGEIILRNSYRNAEPTPACDARM